jgi:hypothetical protein
MRNHKTGVEERLMELAAMVGLEAGPSRHLVIKLLNEFKIRPLDPWFYLSKPEVGSAVSVSDPEAGTRRFGVGQIANPTVIARVMAVLDDGSIVVCSRGKNFVSRSWVEQ